MSETMSQEALEIELEDRMRSILVDISFDGGASLDLMSFLGNELPEEYTHETLDNLSANDLVELLEVWYGRGWIKDIISDWGISISVRVSTDTSRPNPEYRGPGMFPDHDPAERLGGRTEWSNDRF